MSNEDPKIRWNQHPLVLLSDRSQSPAPQWAFVILSFIPPNDHTSLEEYWSQKMRWTVDSTRRIGPRQSIDSIQQDGQFLTFLFQSPSVAMDSFYATRFINITFTLESARSWLPFRSFPESWPHSNEVGTAHGNTAELQVSPSAYLAQRFRTEWCFNAHLPSHKSLEWYWIRKTTVQAWSNHVGGQAHQNTYWTMLHSEGFHCPRRKFGALLRIPNAMYLTDGYNGELEAW